MFRRNTLPSLVSALVVAFAASIDTGAEEIEIAFVTNNASDFWSIAQAGVKKAEKDLGVRCDFRMPANGTAADQQAIVESLIAKGIQGIAISPNDAENQVEMLNHAAEATHLICQDSDAPKSKRLCFVGTNNRIAGKEAGKLIKEVLPKGGKIMLFVGRMDAQNAIERATGIKDELKGSGIEVLLILTDLTDRARAKANVEDTLVRNPDVGCLVGLWSYNGPAILSAVKDAGKHGKIPIVCFDEETDTLQGVQDGFIHATVVQDPYQFGYQSVKVLAALARKQDPGIPASRIVEIPVRIIRKEQVPAFRKETEERRKQGNGQVRMSAPILEARGLCKSFPGVQALKRVNLVLKPGEVLAVIGENGAGKSTLMKILAGELSPDAGEILMEGRPVVIDSVRAAMEHRIALIHQEMNLADNLSAGANIFLGREPRSCGMLRFGAIRNAARALLERVGLSVDPDCLVQSLSLAQQQLVEIAKALSVHARILIMDEPTSSLSQGETERLFRVVKELKSSGVSIVYISHRLGEVKEVADRVSVLRDGENAGEINGAEIDHDRMVQAMVGRTNLQQFYAHVPHPPGKVLLEAEKLRTRAFPNCELSLRLCAHEVVGVAGLVGAGRSDLLQTLFGVEPALSGSVRVAGERVLLDHPRAAIRAGLALVPENRKEQGLILEMAIRSNLSLAGIDRNSRRGFVRRAAERSLAKRLIQRLTIKTPSDRTAVQALSGGNQQKVVLGKWLAIEPRVLLLDEPTRGIDVGAKAEIYRLMEALAAEGIAILFVSSEMEEILAMSDRALVMHQGSIAGELLRAELSESAIMQLATGRAKQPSRNVA